MSRWNVLAAALALAMGCSERREAEPLEGEPLGEQARALIFESEVRTLEGQPASLGDYEGQALLLVNVASECGLTPQYEGLQRLQEEYGERGFTVLGFPCNQFGGQEPGTAEDIRSFCKRNYGVTFPIFEKIEVNGGGRHPIYEGLVQHADGAGEAGDVKWNFEKFLIAADGERIFRFRPRTKPEDPQLVATLESVLP